MIFLKQYIVKYLPIIFLMIILFPLISFGLIKKGTCVSGDCENGRGKFIYHDGNEYIGSWKNGKRHGNGTMIWLQTVLSHYKIDSQQGPYRYDGKVFPIDPIVLPILTVITNVKESKKRKSFNKLDPDIRYMGQWSNDAMDGTGTLYLNDGTIIFGKWKNNNYIGR